MTKSDFRKLLFFKLPIAWIAGLKLKSYSNESAQILVKLSWFNQNPFKSMFWAVQGMAAELSTGILVMQSIRESKKKVSFLVIEQNGKFHKKAVGKITFTCNQGKEVEQLIQQAIESKEGHTILLKSEGVDENGVTVAEFSFLWSVKVKS